MSLVQPEDVTARMAVGMDDADLQKTIDSQEAWLARKIGALVGPRTETYYPEPYGGAIFTRRRPLVDDYNVIVVEQRGTTVDPSMLRISGNRIERHSGGASSGDWGNVAWSGQVRITYTPDDEDDVRDAVFHLVRISLQASSYTQESGEGHSYTAMTSYWHERAVIARALIPNRGPDSVPMH